jgi:uncharacterized protein (TIGR02001 family)
MKIHGLLAAAALIAPLAPAYPFEIASAGLTATATPTLTSNYLFRGISQTRNHPAIQGSLDLQHETGVYVGAFVSNVSFQDFSGSVELDGLFGYRREIAGISFDLGAIWYTYPGTAVRGFEVELRASRKFEIATLLGGIAYSPNTLGRAGAGIHIEAGADIPLPLELSGSLRLGYWNIEHGARFGLPSYLWYGVSLTREISHGVTLTLGWYGTNIARRNCMPAADQAQGGQNICSSSFLAMLSKSF